MMGLQEAGDENVPGDVVGEPQISDGDNVAQPEIETESNQSIENEIPQLETTDNGSPQPVENGIPHQEQDAVNGVLKFRRLDPLRSLRRPRLSLSFPRRPRRSTR